MNLSNYFDVHALQAGDVLLHMGQGPLSGLVAWFGDAIYSHVSIMIDKQNFVEAATSGTRSYALATRLAQSSSYFYIDAYRPATNNGLTPTSAQLDAVVARAKSYIGSPYPVNKLVELGILASLRAKIPQTDATRWVIRLALDAVVKRDPSQVVCSELVYRALAEAQTQPAAAMQPVITMNSPLRLPFPSVDWLELWRELKPMLGADAMPPGASAGESLDSSNSEAPAPAVILDERHSDSALQRSFDEIRSTLIADGANLRAGVAGAIGGQLIIPNPNPKTIAPADLERSPSLRMLGRLKLGG